MAEKPYPKEPEYVACQVCLEEIPESVALSHEANQYAQHFCGIECYSIWKEKQQEANQDPE
jgi:predicted adenine nucleotide alpha hydrolase (AANH) superfamily ATPase